MAIKLIPRSEARQALIEAALVHLSKRGPANVHPKDICEELGLSKALVNYHFGGRDELIVEAMTVGYERYVDLLWSNVQALDTDDVGRLNGFMDGHLEWTNENPGLAMALNFPYIASGMPPEALESTIDRISASGAEHFKHVRTLVGAARAQLKPAADKQSDMDNALDTSCVAWLLLGMAMWSAGQHLPTQRLAPADFYDAAREHARKQMLALISA